MKGLIYNHIVNKWWSSSSNSVLLTPKLFCLSQNNPSFYFLFHSKSLVVSFPPAFLLQISSDKWREKSTGKKVKLLLWVDTPTPSHITGWLGWWIILINSWRDAALGKRWVFNWFWKSSLGHGGCEGNNVWYCTCVNLFVGHDTFSMYLFTLQYHLI